MLLLKEIDMAELQTKVNDANVDKFLGSFPENIQKDCYAIVAMMQKATKQGPKMWGTNIIG